MRVYGGGALPTDNEWDIPVLDEQRCAGMMAMPVTPWGTTNVQVVRGGTWHFYIWDDKFEGLWKKPDRVPEGEPFGCVEVNFSIDPDGPAAVALYQIYRKRWLSRYWQSRGLNIVVDLNVPMRFERLNLLGVPRGWSAYATRGSWDLEKLLHQYALAQEHSGRSNPLFWVYAGGEQVRALAQANRWLYCDTYRGPLVYKGRYQADGSKG
ncbi:DUF4417 domain-containing protein [Laspinema palackyanum]|uniref:DUF4417 domain-containing protein n=1 Tax=Laspinema palackyanum TaxID=3231601 RepID=UPI00345D6094|nr:DUF4417 domain-containing protein [Laspinema sp. D2c]